MALGRFWNGLLKTREGLVKKIQAVLPIRRALDPELLRQLEQALIEADVGVTAAQRMVLSVEAKARKNGQVEPEEVRRVLRDEVVAILESSRPGGNGGEGQSDQPDRPIGSAKPWVILVVGVNGTGKTTLVGRLGWLLRQRGKTVLVAACDTFRAAAQEQLAIWAHRAGADLVESKYGGECRRRRL